MHTETPISVFYGRVASQYYTEKKKKAEVTFTNE